MAQGNKGGKGNTREKLTTDRVQRYKIPGHYWDTEYPAFCVRVNPGGSKTYLVRYRNEMGQQKWTKVGQHPVNTADEARAQAKSILGDSAKGLDPAAERDRKREALTVEDLVGTMREERFPSLAASTVKEYNRQLALFILPAIGKKAAAGVTTKDVDSILTRLRKTKVQRNRVFALLHRMFEVAKRVDPQFTGPNPCLALEKTTEEPRERYLTDEELVTVGAALDTEEAKAEAKSKARRRGDKKAARAIDAEYLQSILALKFLLFSGRRKSEALRLRWSQVNLEARSMRIDTKTGSLTVDINDQMNEVLQKALQFRQLGNPFVFPGRPQKPKPGEGKPVPKPWVNLMKPWNRILKMAGVWTDEDERTKEETGKLKPTIHDIRRTFGTVGAGDVELPHETIGKVLGHKQTSTTQIYAQLAGKKRSEASAKIGAAMAKKLKKQA